MKTFIIVVLSLIVIYLCSCAKQEDNLVAKKQKVFLRIQEESNIGEVTNTNVNTVVVE